MDRAKSIVLAFLNSAEGYFHTKTVLENSVKQPRGLYGPMSNRPEKWNYTDIRDLTASDLKKIIAVALKDIDKDLFKIIPGVALNASLQSTIHTLDNGKYQSKLDSNLYNFLLSKMSSVLSGGK